MALIDVRPPGWPQPKGYANGICGEGRILLVGGQIGWTPDGTFEHGDFIGQMRQALRNVIAVVEAAGGNDVAARRDAVDRGRVREREGDLARA